MGTASELNAILGTITPSDTATPRQNWETVCVCGHLERYHSESVGGTAEPPSYERDRGLPYAFHGCRGELATKGFVVRSHVRQDNGPPVLTENPTCPCREFRPVAEVDRVNRMFNQRRPKDRSDRGRHPFMTGCRAMRTRISKLKAVDGDPAKRDAEFERRFHWLDGARVCGAPECTATDDVWPVFVDDRDRSELRCEKHR